MTTTATVLPSAWAALHAALEARRPIWVTYHGRRRLLCPHALGWKANRSLLLAYQTAGQTTTGTLPTDPRQRWRCLYLDEIDHVTAADAEAAWASASNYNPTRPFPAIDQLAAAIPPDRPVR